MTDTPPSWQDDPTGRHDHRYWDGTQWTEHVADAGVASLDPYDAPTAPTAPEPAAEPEAPAAAEPTVAPSSGWGQPSAEPAATEQPAATEEPAPLTWRATPSATTPAAPATGWSVPSEPEPEAEPAAEPEPEAEPARSTVSGWGQAADVTEVTPATEVTEVAGLLPEPAAEPTDADGPPPEGVSRRPLVLALAALAVVGLVVAVIAFAGGDDGDDGPDAIAAEIVTELRQDDHALDGTSEEDARCVADHIVDEVGATRLDGVDFGAEAELPAELNDDMAAALVSGIEECDVDFDASSGSDDGSDDGADDGTDATTGENPNEAPTSDIDLGNPDDLERLLVESFVNTQELERGKAECLAKALTDAIRNGETTADNPFSDPDGYRRFLEECDISEAEVGIAPS